MSYEAVKIGDRKIEAMAVDGYLDTADISELLHVPNNTIYTFIRAGKLIPDSGSCIRYQRKKFEVNEFKKFLVGNPKYYARVYGDVSAVEVLPVAEVCEPVESEESAVLVELMDKMESIESMIKKNSDSIKELTEQNKELEAKRIALEKVIDMF